MDKSLANPTLQIKIIGISHNSPLFVLFAHKSRKSKFSHLMSNDIKTLNQFIVERQADFPYAKGELSRLLSDIGAASKIINREVNQAGLVEILGKTGHTNVQGEEVQKLDEFANKQIIAALSSGGECCLMASEENDDIIPVENEVAEEAKYVINFDPLDGSSNIDVCAPIGTIFAIYRRKSATNSNPTLDDALQKGREQVASGYVLYGSSTMLVYTTGNGVNGFTLDPSIGEFCLSHPDIQTPEKAKVYSVNEGNYYDYPKGYQQYIEDCKTGNNIAGKPYKERYIGSLVADFHRNLLQGGVFMYPPTDKDPQGKLRLVYEANPLAFIAEQAGGKASDGSQIILDKEPESLHQRTPLVIGSKKLVEEVEEHL